MPHSEATENDFTVLVINSSRDMAKEITFQLSSDIPGCSIMYAPTIELAKWILTRREINLVVSSDILPDGNVAKLTQVFLKRQSPPDLVIVGGSTLNGNDIINDSHYQFKKYRCISDVPTVKAKQGGSGVSQRSSVLTSALANLGDDIRNDLNNPLQAIVAMAFVAQSSRADPGVIEQALDSIERAAKNMSQIVNGLEDKIRDVVAPIASGDRS